MVHILITLAVFTLQHAVGGNVKQQCFLTIIPFVQRERRKRKLPVTTDATGSFLFLDIPSIDILSIDSQLNIFTDEERVVLLIINSCSSYHK